MNSITNNIPRVSIVSKMDTSRVKDVDALDEMQSCALTQFKKARDKITNLLVSLNKHNEREV
jgi:hypothetical protein